MYTHLYICEKLITKTQSLKLALALQAHFSGLALNAVLEKSLLCIRIAAQHHRVVLEGHKKISKRIEHGCRRLIGGLY